MTDETSYLKDNDRFAVYGLGRSGLAAAKLLHRRGKEVVVSDPGSEEELADRLDELPANVEVILGRNDPAGADLVVVSPGLRPGLAVFDDLRANDIPFISEIELAADVATAPILAITGTDGKTTTTELVGEMCGASRFESAVGGNIGTPLSAVVDDVGPAGVIVAEVSAFQLWTSYRFRPEVAGYTNIAGDHLDYFDNPAGYAEAKHRLEQNSGEGDWVAYNADDETLRGWSRECSGRTILYGFDDALADESTDLQVWADEAEVRWRRDGGEWASLIERDAIPLPGPHNVSNVMCAAGMALAFGVEPDAIREAVDSFEALPHRVESCGTVDGVEFVNDSKATNVHSALAGLGSVDGSLVVIAGGLDKGLELDDFCRTLRQRADTVVLIGEVADRMERELGDDVACERAETLPEAVERAFERAQASGATVILSPAASSFDMFESYQHRGEVFRAAVEALRK